ncbi:MAG: hypothetical protein FD167_162 [bacterium]|nr:MAG: hypothetical protein FD167_162 [bacterium]
MSNLPLRTRIFIAMILIAIGVAFINQLLSEPTNREKEKVGRIVTDSTKAWVKVNTPQIPDIAAFAFDNNEQVGLAISSEGQTILSTDGGSSWKETKRMQIEGETITSLAITQTGKILVGSMVEDSTYTALYSYQNGKWLVDTGSYAGITSISSDGRWATGGGGVVYKVTDNGKLEPSELPIWAENSTIYSLSTNPSSKEKLLVTGDYGLVAESIDAGQNWSLVPLKTQAPLYTSLLLENTAYLGGVETFFCFAGSGSGVTNATSGTTSDATSNSGWYKVKELKPRQTIFTIYQDKTTEVFAAGGKIDGSSPFILSSTDNLTWHSELVNKGRSRVVSLARGKRGLFAATQLGEILIRQDIDAKFN